jgi:L-cysteine:1D-myo-inositol 2-amino-2-deoxy-alpha-D-glucopyranoside ligase
MVGYQGEKMSKSIGNLVFVRQLLERVPAATVRLLLAGHHHRAAWEYTEADLDGAEARRRRYATAARAGAGMDGAEAAEWRARFLERIDDDLDAPGALQVADRLADRLVTTGTAGPADGAALLARLLDLVGAASAVQPAP